MFRFRSEEACREYLCCSCAGWTAFAVRAVGAERVRRLGAAAYAHAAYR
jgi:hypothetical protein